MKAINLSRAVFGISSLCLVLAATADHQQGLHEHPTKAAYSEVAPHIDAQIQRTASGQAQPLALEISHARALTQPLAVCVPEADEDKPALRSDCITLLEDVSKRKGRYAATSRDKRELRSLCANQWLPRCRHKY